MPWINFPNGEPTSPPSDRSFVARWRYRIQPWEALAERWAAVYPEQPHYPPPNVVWEFGVVDSIADNGDGTYTVAASGVGDWGGDTHCTSERWVSYSCEPACATAHIPNSYDLIIEVDPDDPFKTVRGTILAQTYNATAHTGTLMITGNGIADALTAKYLPSTSPLVGAKWYIIKQGGLWSSDRRPDKPDDQQLWVGKDSVGGDAQTVVVTVTGSPTAGTFTLAVDGFDGSPVAFNASSAAVLAGIPAPIAVQVSKVTGNPGGPWTITRDRPHDAAAIVMSATTMNGGGNLTFGTPVKIGSFLLDTSPVLADQLANADYGPLIVQTNAIAEDAWVASATGVTPVRPAREVLVYGDDGLLHRETITHNSAGTSTTGPSVIRWVSRSYVASGGYIVVPIGAVGKPARTFSSFLEWYAGAKTEYRTHLPNDKLGTFGISALFGSYLDGDACAASCSEQIPYIFDDGDLTVPLTSNCAGASAGDYFNPYFPKSFRYLQKTVEKLCEHFANAPDGPADAFYFSVATFFQTLGINSWSTSYSYLDGATLTVIAPPGSAIDTALLGGGTLATIVEYPLNCWYTVINDDGTFGASGKGTLNKVGSDYRLGGGPFFALASPPVTPYPVSVVLSLGWDRWKPRQFAYMWNKTCFVPSINTGGGVVDPPGIVTNDDGSLTPYCGTWVKKLKSTHFVRWGTDDGIMHEGQIPFDDGARARYIGDNPGGPAIFDPSGDPIAAVGTNPLYPYYDKFFRGTYDKPTQLARIASASGTCTYGSKTSIGHDGDWWTDGINGTFVASASGLLFSIVPFTPGPPIVQGSAVVTVSVPNTAATCDFAIIDHTTGATVLAGTASVTGGASTISLTGLFTSGMTGDHATITFHGTLHVEHGTVTGGTSTSIEDTGHNLSGTNNVNACWWASGRFLGFGTGATPFQEFILEVDRAANGSSPALSWRMPVLSASITTTKTTVNVPAQPYQGVFVLTCTGTSGTFSLSDGTTTGTAIPYNASASAVLSGIPASARQHVAGVTGTGPWVITVNDSGVSLSVVSGGTASASIGSLITATFNPTAGDTWRIREPAYELNKWQDRTVVLKALEGTLYCTIATHSDDKRAYFDTIYNGADINATTLTPATGVIPAAGWTFTIGDTTFGGVWKWSACKSRWTVPTGHDSVRGWTKTPRDFLPDQTCNREWLVKDFGNLSMCDLWTGVNDRQIYHAINLLDSTFVEITGWNSSADLSSTELSQIFNYNFQNDIHTEYSGCYLDPDETAALVGYFFDNSTAPGSAYDYYETNSPGLYLFSNTFAGALAGMEGVIDSHLPPPGGPSLYWGDYGPIPDLGDIYLRDPAFNLRVGAGAPYKVATSKGDIGIPESNYNSDTIGSVGATVAGQYAYAYIDAPPTDGIPFSIDWYNFSDTYNGLPESVSTFTFLSDGLAVHGGTFGVCGSRGYWQGTTANQFESSGDKVRIRQWEKWDTGFTTVGDKAVSPRLGSPTKGKLPQLSPHSVAFGELCTVSGQAGYLVLRAVAIKKFHFDFTGPTHD